MSSYDEEADKQEYIPSNIINLPRNEDDIYADFKKHLNLDFEEVGDSNSNSNEDRSYEGL